MKIKQIFLNLSERKLKSVKTRERLKKIGKDITFSVWWWIAKRFGNEKLDYVLMKMADYYSEKIECFNNMLINDIVVINNTIFIHLIRPGMMIGRGGENIEKLTEYINTNVYGDKIENFNVYLIEDNRSWNYMFFKHFNRYNR